MKKMLLALIIILINANHGRAGMREISCKIYGVKTQLLNSGVGKRKLTSGDIFLMDSSRKLIASRFKQSVGNVKAKWFLIYVASGDEQTREEVLTVKTIYDRKVKEQKSGTSFERDDPNLVVELSRPNYRNPHKCNQSNRNSLFKAGPFVLTKRSKVSIVEYVKFHREDGANKKLKDFHINFKKGTKNYKCLNTAKSRQKYRLDNRKKDGDLQRTYLKVAEIFNKIGKSPPRADQPKVAANVQHIKFQPKKNNASCFRLLLTNMSKIEQITIEKVGGTKKIVWQN